MKAEPFAKRFWRKVMKTNGCWIWTGSLTTHGYGQLSVDLKPMGAHRVSWELHFGPIPKGFLVCHKCDNRKCVRPSHLFLGANIDNSLDALKKDRLCRGEIHGSAKLSWKDVKSIRSMHSSGSTQTEVADLFSISQSEVSRIVNLKRFASSGIKNSDSESSGRRRPD